MDLLFESGDTASPRRWISPSPHGTDLCPRGQDVVALPWISPRGGRRQVFGLVSWGRSPWASPRRFPADASAPDEVRSHLPLRGSSGLSHGFPLRPKRTSAPAPAQPMISARNASRGAQRVDGKRVDGKRERGSKAAQPFLISRTCGVGHTCQDGQSTALAGQPLCGPI